MSKPSIAEKVHNYQDLIRVFNQCFQRTLNTILVKGDGEPIYLPADHRQPFNEIQFAHGFFASALHESAHWLIAGEQRRKWVDFGYWYEPDGRSAAQQQEFEKVEVKPQAIEWILSEAAGFRFQVSVDNLNGDATDPKPFKRAVYQQVLRYLQQGLPDRTNTLRAALVDFYNTPEEVLPSQFNIDSI